MATFTNSATLSYNGNVTMSNTVTGTLQEILTAEKTSVVDSYTEKGTVTYAISLVNSGNAGLTNLTVKDDLGAYVLGEQTLHPLSYVADSIKYYVNGVLQAAPAVAPGPPIEITGINVPAGGNAMLIYEVAANQFAPLTVDSTVTNTAEVTGTGIATPVTASETISTRNLPVLTINKLLNPTTVTDNSQLTYTFTIQNTGNTPADAAANIILEDDFDPILDPIAVTFNGVPWEATTNYTYDTGAFATVAGQITVPAATYTQDTATGVWTITPGISTLVVTGTV